MRRIHLMTLGAVTTTVVALAIGLAGSAAGEQTVAAGDIVQTGLNGMPVIGEVIRAAGATADLNAGQNNKVPLLSVGNMKVLQKAGTGGKSSCTVGESVKVRSLANALVPGRILKTNGAYCEIDSSGSGFTGWSMCSDVLRAPGGTCAPPAPAGQARAGAAASAGPHPPRPGLTSCAGKIEGRYASAMGQGGLTIEFRSGKATLKGPLVDDEVAECWTSGTKIVLHKQGDPNDLELDINKDGSIDTPFGELKKKGN